MPHLWKTVSVGACRLLAGSLARLGPHEVESLAGHVGATLGNERHRAALRGFARELARENAGRHYDMDANGERRLLQRTAPLGLRTLFDVGANRGEWTLAARPAHPAAEIHCFEIVPATFETLREALAGMEGVVLNPVGLAEQEGEVEVFLQGASAISSMFDFGGGDARACRCKVVRGADYAAARGLERIDLMKIDTEGAENLVMKGFGGMLEGGAIRIIQFEYNRGAIESGFLLKNFYQLLGARGYVLGKLTGSGVVFAEYDRGHEDFVGPNYVACRRDDAEAIGALAAPG